ncbi:MAG TPA: MFS transporter [Actinospica sp.]|jgi:MFS family permease|nr:MFS transporter [Actinospica sp.]
MSNPQSPPPDADADTNPLHDKVFRWFLTARAVSILGNAMSPVALAFAVLQATNSPRDLSYVLTASMIPTVTLIIVGGGIADRFRRDMLLRVTNVLSGLSQAGVAACVLTRQPIVFLVLLAAFGGTVTAFSRPALGGIVPQIVKRDGIQKANSILATTRNTATVLGPTVAGVLVATIGGGWAIALDSLSFFVAAGCMVFVNLPTKPKKKPGGLLRELRHGWSYFSSTPWIWTGTVVFAVINAIQVGVWQVLGPIIAKGTIGAEGWGVVLSVKAVGLLVMSAVMTRLTVRRPFVSGMAWLAVCAAPLIALGLRADTIVLAVGALVAGFGSAYSGVIWDTIRHKFIPTEMMGRATAFDDFGSFAGIPVGQLSVIPIAAAIGTRHVALYGGIVYFMVPLLPLVLASVRNLGVELPAKEPEVAEPGIVIGG